MLPVFKNVRERYMAKNYRLDSLRFGTSKAFGKLLNNRFVDDFEKCDHCQYGADLHGQLQIF